ncbi:MAG: DMT family transporter [Alphaproteobacteria bacterium]
MRDEKTTQADHPHHVEAAVPEAHGISRALGLGGRASGFWAGLSPTSQGALWLLASAFLFTVMQVLVKFLGNRLHPLEVAFFRSVLGFVFILPFVLWKSGLAGFHTIRPGLHLVRGIAGSCAMMGNFYAIANLPLADATTISFSRALFVVPLAMLILSEVVGPRRLIATLVGFVGVLIVMRPTGSFEPAALVGLGGAASLALGVTCVKVLSRTDSALSLLLYSAIIGSVLTAIPTFFLWTTPTWSEAVLIVVMGGVGVVAHNCFIRAYSMADATALAPLDYTRILFAAVFGFFLFANVPDIWTITGALIIVASTLYITIREARAKG